MPTIEELWQSIRSSSDRAAQRRVDADHPHDIYVDFEPPNRPGLVAVCASRPPALKELRAVSVDVGQRADGRWSIRLSLDRADLFPVFATLCRDIVDTTRYGTGASQLASTVVGRLEHWRRLLERDARGLSEAELRGLVGELCFLDHLLGRLSPREAVSSWTGPLGTPQDFLLPDGLRVEVKTARPHAATVRINGLAQLATGTDPLELVVVRLVETGASAPDAFNAAMLIERLRVLVATEPSAAEAFEASLSLAGWHEHQSQSEPSFRLLALERHLVGPGFPRLTPGSVPAGVQDADYVILLPAVAAVAAH